MTYDPVKTRTTVQIAVRVPHQLLARIDQAVQAQPGESRTSLILETLAKAFPPAWMPGNDHPLRDQSQPGNVETNATNHRS